MLGIHGNWTRFRTIFVVLAAVIAALTVTLVTPTNASAATTTCDSLGLPGIKSPDGGAQVCFQAYGEHILLCDSKADGHHPAVIYDLDFTTSDTRVDDATLSYGICRDIDEDLPENHQIYFKALNVEGSTTVSYSGWFHTTT
ncbi:hypothetical protein OG780_14995 [Streptomyces sp. NBC_00386]|uniref:hypothetical protein n=1 Tax=Streptomyces sp. NBC_00386 TaxID=2975734 RepID=UPI002E2341D2